MAWPDGANHRPVHVRRLGAVRGLPLAVVDHPPALADFGDEGAGVGVAGARHSIHDFDGTPWHHQRAMDELEIRWLMAPDARPMPTLEDLLQRPAWHQRAACRGAGHEGFVIGHGAEYDDHARRLLRRLPVRQECLETALADEALTGMWGGTTPVQRRAMRRARAVA